MSIGLLGSASLLVAARSNEPVTGVGLGVGLAATVAGGDSVLWRPVSDMAGVGVGVGVGVSVASFRRAAPAMLVSFG